ncbi:hypothetical protein E2C01_069253 [Portunus trituberculatus]|uniref:Uncharacterized protein n=1 Tax=Portunus trituberculatus TaxID=210409 RepID=A0A5B7HYE3_PORTR|nr:hypothetical protein [Portunus trituberculatus]
MRVETETVARFICGEGGGASLRHYRAKRMFKESADSSLWTSDIKIYISESRDIFQTKCFEYQVSRAPKVKPI